MKLIYYVFLISCISSCENKSVDTENTLRQTILKKYNKVSTTLKNGDPSYVVSLHTKDAVQFLANGTEIVGIEALKLFYKRIAAMGIDIKSTPLSIEILSGDTAFEVGVFHSTSKSGQQDSAKYIIVWKKIGDDWKIHKAIDQAKF
jgi:ketosteroid isomerase-like protein